MGSRVMVCRQLWQHKCVQERRTSRTVRQEAASRRTLLHMSSRIWASPYHARQSKIGLDHGGASPRGKATRREWHGTPEACQARASLECCVSTIQTLRDVQCEPRKRDEWFQQDGTSCLIRDDVRAAREDMIMKLAKCA